MIKRAGSIGRAACLLALLLLAAACGQIDAQDPLTRKERAWLEEHGPVSVASDATYHPLRLFGGERPARGHLRGHVEGHGR